VNHFSAMAGESRHDRQERPFMSRTQSLIAWSDEFSLGMPEIDAQHQVLIDLINQVWIAIIPSKPDQEHTIRIVEELEKYTLTHFTDEEVFMRKMWYPKFREHKGAHDQFVARVAQEKAKIASGQRLTLDMVYFLRDWLINHILVSDKEYAEEFKQQSAPTSILGRFFKRLRG
jgi:hemerythrin-like metal-binding protein